jgi:hypothetical protein
VRRPFSLVQQDERMLIQQVGDQGLVGGGVGNHQALLAVALGDRIAARLLEKLSRRSQCPGARQRQPLRGRCVQERPQCAGAFGGEPASPPELAQRGGQPQARLGVGLGQGKGDRGPQVAEFGIQPVQPAGLAGAPELWGGRLGEGQVVVAVRGPGAASRRALGF